MFRRVALVAILASAAWLVIAHASDVSQLIVTARSGSWTWLLAAAVLQVGYYACYVLTYRQSFASAGIERRFGELVPVVLAAVFVGTVVPSGGTAGPGLIVDDAVRRGSPAGHAAAAALVAQFTDFSGFAVVMAGGFAYLAVIGRLTLLELVAALAFTALVGVLGGVLVLARRNPALLLRVLTRVERMLCRGAELLRLKARPEFAERFAEELHQAVGVISQRRRFAVSAWAVAVIGHLLDLACFIAVGFAFGWFGVGALVAGYAIGIVVWLTSFVPQGVGVVEGAVSLLLATLGVPAGTALAISLTFRGLTFWIPLGIGSLMLPRVSTFAATDRAKSTLVARASAVFVFVVGVVNILSAATPSLASRIAFIERYLPFQMTYGHLSAALAGVGLLMLSRGLSHHKHTAYVLTVGLLAASAVSHLVKGLDWEEALVASSVMIWLVVNRSAFYARSDEPSIRQGLRVLAGAFAITLAYGAVGFWLLDRQFSVNFGLRAALVQTFDMFVYFYDPGIEPITGFGRYFADSIYLIGAATLAFALLMLLRPVLVRHPASAAEHRRARAIVDEWGSTSLSPMALLPDKAYWFSPGGSLIAYALSGGIAVVLGEPIGPPDDAVEAVAGFTKAAAINGWRVVWYEVREDSLEGLFELGFSAVHTGNEAIVDLHSFTLAGKSHKSLRHRINQLDEAGYQAQVIEAPVPATAMRQLRHVSDAWLASMKGAEKRFALGWFDEHYLRGCPVMVVRAPSGEIVAFANLLFERRANEATIDLMRYLPDAPSGTMDYLFVRLIEYARDRGFATFNLGVSPLAGVGESAQDPAAEKALRLVYEHGSAFYGFKGLRAYKDKFDPRWEKRYLVYPEGVLLPTAFAATTHVNSGENPIMGYLESVLRPSRAKVPQSADA